MNKTFADCHHLAPGAISEEDTAATARLVFLGKWLWTGQEENSTRREWVAERQS